MASTCSFDFVNNQQSYKSSFDYYNLSRIEQQKAWVASDLVPAIANNLSLGPQETFSVLAVGSSKGCFDFLFLQELLNLIRQPGASFKPARISWTVVEPGTSALEEYKRRVSQESDNLIDVDFNWVNGSFESFVDGCRANSDKQKYHLVHFVSCLYYIDEELAIRETFDHLLAPEGLVLAIVGTVDDIWDLMIKKFKDQVPTLASELHYTTSKTVVDLAKKNGWKYDAFVGRISLAITEMFTTDSPAGSAILQFYMHTKEDPRITIQPQIISAVLEFFNQNSWTQVIEGKEEFLVREDEGIVILSNS